MPTRIVTIEYILRKFIAKLNINLVTFICQILRYITELIDFKFIGEFSVKSINI